MGNDYTKNWILKTLTHTLAKISHMVSSSEADARSLESHSLAAPPPEVSIHILSCSWALLLGLFQTRSWVKPVKGGQLVRGPVNGPMLGVWGQGGVGLRGKGVNWKGN